MIWKINFQLQIWKFNYLVNKFADTQNFVWLDSEKTKCWLTAALIKWNFDILQPWQNEVLTYFSADKTKCCCWHTAALICKMKCWHTLVLTKRSVDILQRWYVKWNVDIMQHWQNKVLGCCDCQTVALANRVMTKDKLI